MKTLGIGVVILLLNAPVLSAGPIERACRQSDRPASAQTCRCIQKVANVTLGRADQRKVASFIKKPEKSQTMKRSDTQSNEAFWDRFEGFNAHVRRQCG